MNAKLTEQIYLMMKDKYYPSPMTHGTYLFKRVLEEFFKLSGMPLGHETLAQAVPGITESELDRTLKKLIGEGYIENIESPASFLFPGKQGEGYKLVMGEEENEAREKVEMENKVSDSTSAQVAQSPQASN